MSWDDIAGAVPVIIIYGVLTWLIITWMKLLG